MGLVLHYCHCWDARVATEHFIAVALQVDVIGKEEPLSEEKLCPVSVRAPLSPPFSIATSSG